MDSDEREIGRFEAIDHAGKSYTILQVERVELARDVNGNLHAFGGLKRLELLTGEHVNSLQDGGFQIFETGQIIRRKVG